MAATMKHRRSSSKRRSAQGSDRYSKVLTKAKTIKKSGGKFLSKSKTTGLLVPSHRVSKNNPVYKGIKILNSKGK